MDNIAQQWSSFEKLVFRFVFLLFLLFMIFFNNGTLPLMYMIMKVPMLLLHQFIPWLGKNMLHIPYDITVFTNGSGDTTYDYVVLLCIALLAIGGTLMWSVFDWKKLNYNRMYYWITVAVRFYVGLMLINYGMIKVIQLQFPAPSFYRLLTTYGESSPMGLAWTFLGFSKGYNLFMGIAELMAGLLFFRRTVAIGAIITLMTTANVMAVNYFYDVPVKIVSTALVVMCLFLLAPNVKRLFNFFFKGEAVLLRTLDAPLLNKRWKRNTKYALKYLLIVYSLVGVSYQVFTMRKVYGRDKPKSPLYGVYEVDTFTKNNKVITELDQDPKRWKMIMFEGETTGAIRTYYNETQYREIKVDTLKKVISIMVRDEPKTIQYLNYKFTDPIQLLIKGKYDNDSISVELTRKRFELTDRQLNWINENPFNR
jgi:hypothetical protein